MYFDSQSLRAIAGKARNMTGAQNPPTALYLALLMAGIGEDPKQLVANEIVSDETSEWTLWAANETTLFAGRCLQAGLESSDVEVVAMPFAEIVGVRVHDVQLHDSFSSAEIHGSGAWTFRDRSGGTITVPGRLGSRPRDEAAENLVAAVLAAI